MALPSFNDSGLAADARVQKAYELAKDVVDLRSAGHQDYLAATLAVMRTLQSLPDADDGAKARWAILAFTSVATEFAGTRRQEITPQAEALLAGSGAQNDKEYNFDDPATDIAGAPADMKVIVAAGIVHSLDTVKNLRDPDIIQAVKERFNRHAAGIAPGDIPASLHQKMTATLTQINAFTLP